MIRSLSIFILLALVGCGCVSQKSCSVKNTPDATYVTVSKDSHGLLVGICGFTTHTSVYYVFELPEHKAEYHGGEICEVSGEGFYTNRYDGSISIFSAEKRIVINLQQEGHSFALNGTYHYQ